jgi:hypothetical protein
MPLYFFRIADGEGASRIARDGIELADDSAAWEEATTACGEMLRDLDGALKAGSEWRMEVTRGSGEILYRLTFSTETFENTDSEHTSGETRLVDARRPSAPSDPT